MAKETFGSSWWGAQWVDAFKCIDYNSKMSKGLELAKLGLVKHLDLEGTTFTASIELGRYDPIAIRIGLPKLTDVQKKKIVDRIAKVPALLSDLQNRKLPTNLLFFCNKHRIKLIPNEWYDLDAEDSSPFANIPTQFMTAVIYKIASEIDKNPFLIFEMHEFDVFAELEKQGHMMGGKKQQEVLSIDTFWDGAAELPEQGASLDRVEPVDLSTVPDLLDGIFTLLEEKPLFYFRRDFKKILKKAYKDIAKSATKWNKLDKSYRTQDFDSINAIKLFVNASMKYQAGHAISFKGDVADFADENELVYWLEGIPKDELYKSTRIVRLLEMTYRWSIILLRKYAYLPQLLKFNDSYKVRWVPALLNDQVRNTHNELSEQFKDVILFRSEEGKDPVPVNIKEQILHISSIFLTHFVSQLCGHEQEDFEGDKIMSMFFHKQLHVFDSFEHKEYPDIISLWLNKFYLAEKKYVPLIKVEDAKEGFEVQLFIEQKKSPDIPPISLKSLFTNEAFKDIKFDALKEILQLVEFFPETKKLVDSEGKDQLVFNSGDFANVIYKTLPVMRMFGIRILLPKGMKDMMKPKVSMKIKGENPNVENFSMVGMAGLLDFDWQIALGNTVVSQDEFLSLVESQSGIVKINDEYIFIDDTEVEGIIKQLHKQPTEMGIEDLLQVALAEDYDGATISLDENAQELMGKMLEGDAVEIPKGLKATLRPYQQRGFEWMFKNTQLGFGSLIADDMGLGKTLQVITTLLKFKEVGMLDKEKALVIVPTTLLTNWEKEIAKFAPSLSTNVFHGANRALDVDNLADVTITTYGVIRSKTAEMSKIHWKVVAIDEAQNIKNPNTSQTKAVKKMQSDIRIAMSGTPVENRLSEYWSIFDFVNKGYLGTLREFKNEYARPIEVERDQKCLERFKKVTSPFILRRVKSDRSIIKDLPEKIEMDQYAQLTEGQAAIYQSVVDSIMAEVESAEGIQRKGQVLRLITGLKQICNHPVNYSKEGNQDILLSGKGAEMLQIVTGALVNQEKTLIFTQYKEMGNILSAQLKEKLGVDAPFLHGGLTRNARDKMVDDFQTNPAHKVMILSLKAAGTGLNLTAASNVIHYDMWWNPAVEAQATDRAYRIGQKNNVMVHRLLTKDTFEEKINFLLQDKKELANLTVSNGEQWIGDLSNNELRELVKLS